MKPIQIDPETRARIALGRVKKYWKQRPWGGIWQSPVTVLVMRSAIRHEIGHIRAAYPKHPPCEPVPYRVVDSVEIQAEASARFREDRWLREVWEGRIPKMRWDGNQWVEVAQ
jgi:hypothetical protein